MKRLILYQFFCIVSLPSYTQNVGIGTKSPTEKLEVAGTIKADTIKSGAVKITTDAGAGKILTSDAQGNASWKDQRLNSAMQARTDGAGSASGFGGWGDCETNSNISGFFPVTDTAYEEGDRFGWAVDMTATYAVIGSPLDAKGSIAQQGSVSIYQFDGTDWTFMQKLVDPNGAANDHFGFSVEILGNYVFVGVPDDDVGSNTSQGSVCVFQLVSGSWTFIQKITDATGSANDNFGRSLSASGKSLLVGSPGDDDGVRTDAGSASIFTINGTWQLVIKVVDANGASGDFFGSEVSISGDNAVIASPYDDAGAYSTQGSVCFFDYTQANGWRRTIKISPPVSQANQMFGSSVSISGKYAFISAPEMDGTGSVYTYELKNGSWQHIQKLIDPYSMPTPDGFGSVVLVAGDYAMVTASGHGGALGNGATFLYYRLGPQWRQLQVVGDPAMGAMEGRFGEGLAIDSENKRFLIGSYGFAEDTGCAVFGKIN